MWQAPSNYEQQPGLEAHLRSVSPRPGTVLFKMVVLVTHGKDVSEIELSQAQARKAIDERIVPNAHFEDVLLIALDKPRAPHGGGPAVITNRFRFAIDDLPAWEPGGSSETERLAAIAELAERSFEAQDADDETVFDNPDIPAGYTYLGQFVDHDITLDERPLGSQEDRSGAANAPPVSARTVILELDSVYGPTPGKGPMYEKDKRLKVGVGFGKHSKGSEIDLPRKHDHDLAPGRLDPNRIIGNEALIGDGRNDENLIVAQIHLAFHRFHNTRMAQGDSFDTARKETIRHYQWVVLHDFLKRICGSDFVDFLLADPHNRRFPFPQDGKVFMPVEFSIAAYRFGHSMVRPSYELNDPLTAGPGPIDIFGAGDNALSGLRGGRRLPAFWQLQMDRFFDFDGSEPAQRSRRIDAKLAPQLVSLPEFRSEARDPRMLSLPFRNLRRSWQNGLPSGQDLAKRLGLTVLNPGNPTPLWLYVLQEARVMAHGRRLGPLGAHIVAETLIGLLSHGKISIIREGWKPANSGFDFPAFLKAAEMPTTAADLPF